MLHKLTHSQSCRDVTRLLSQGEDRSLSWGERIRLRVHLLVCRACSRFEHQMRVLRLAMRQYRE
ncbi:MAG: zf-HC2 domain-containing protein [Betaproteobacteria bacterium]